jgi:hypothetical protein
VSALPPALAPWGPALAGLDAQVAVAIGPMVRRLDALLAPGEPDSDGDGPLDGYDGLTRRGIPERLLMSEWLLADELPLEFLRRAASGELLHLAPARPSAAGRGRVAVLADTGPEQLGAARLVHLAAMIVLRRQAEARGTGLVVGVLGDPPGAWREDDTALSNWLRSRSRAEPGPHDVDGWAATLDDSDEAWLLTGPRLAGRAAGWRRTIVSRPSAWSADGVTAVRVTVRGTTVELPLPGRDDALRVVRGALVHRPDLLPSRAGLRVPRFADRRRRLLARGRTTNEIVDLTVPQRPGGPGKARRHQMASSVLAADWIDSRRLVVVTADRNGRIEVQVIGRQGTIGTALSAITATMDDLGLGPGDSEVERLTAGELPSLLVDPRPGGGLLVRLDGMWSVLTAEGSHPAPEIAGAGPSDGWGWLALRDGVGIRFLGDLEPVAPGGATVLGGADSDLAWSDGPGVWRLRAAGRMLPPLHVQDGEVIRLVRVGADATVAGPGVVMPTQPGLLSLSATGLTLRLHTHDGTRTLTRWSGGVGPPLIHATLPLAGIVRADGTLEVGDLGGTTTLMALSAGTEP